MRICVGINYFEDHCVGTALLMDLSWHVSSIVRVVVVLVLGCNEDFTSVTQIATLLTDFIVEVRRMAAFVLG